MPKKFNWKDVVPERDFRFAPPKQMQHGGYSVRVEVQDEETGRCHPFVHQGPELSCPFGLSKKDGVNGGDPRYVATLSFPTVKFDPIKEQFYGEEEPLAYMKFIKSIDDYNKKKAAEQCKTWFKKDISEAVIDEFYFHNIYISDKCKQGEYSPTFTTKLQYYRDKFETDFYQLTTCDPTEAKYMSHDGTHYRVETTCFEDHQTPIRRCIPLLETTGLWFAGKQFGMSFRVVQLMIFSQDGKFEGCAIDPVAAMDFMKVAAPLPISPAGMNKKRKIGDTDDDSVPVTTEVH